MIKTFLLLIIFVSSLFSVFVSGEITCRNELTGEPVDWFTLYKLPRRTTIEESSQVNNPFIEQGLAYTFMTNLNTEWKLSQFSFNDTQSNAGQTIQPMYDSKKIGYILYNDQADKVTILRGHTKGIILFDETSAIWIVHSIPHFPPKASEGKYYIQPSQCIYGQSMLCMSLSIDKLEQIGLQLLFNYPQIYDHFIPEHLNFISYISNLNRVINGEHIEASPWFNMNPIVTRGGEHLLSFAKFTNFGDDLYSGLVAPNLLSDLLTETWNNGAGTLESNCSNLIQYQVHNIEQVKFESLGIRFSVHRDHSKWAVTDGKHVKIACIGDINRQSEQFKRAGGTICFMNNEKVWSQYNQLIDQIEPCKRKRMFKKMKQRFRKFKANDSNEIIILL